MTASYVRQGKWFVVDGTPFPVVEGRLNCRHGDLLGGYATLDDTLRFIRAMTAPAKACGYILAPYGSTLLDGEGKDIDVLAVPMQPARDWRALLAMFVDHGWNEYGSRTFGRMNLCAVSLWHPEISAWVDLHIREVDAPE